MGDGAEPEVFTKVAYVKDIPLPSSSTDLIDVTDHDSPGGRKEYIGGLIDSDEMTITINWDAENATHEALEDGLGDLINWEIELNNKLVTKGTTYAFAAVLRSFKPKAPVNGVYEADITLKPSGSVTKTPAS
jgi:hypothetical protein